MTPGRRSRSVAAVLIVLAACAAILAHLAIAQRFSPALGAALSLVPAAGLAFWLARRSPRRAWIVAGVALAALALWLGWGSLERNFPGVFFVEHAGGNLFLALVFGRTLAPGREPLCTRFATMLHGPLPPEVARYTRRITAAWTLFFAAVAALSATLYLAGDLKVWSALATIASPILVVLMFAVEYAVRLRALPHWKHPGILDGIRAFSRHVSARFETPR